MTLYKQCVLMQEYEYGRLFTVGWIEERAAHLGVKVTLKGEDGWWTVRESADPPRTIQDIEEINKKSRRSLNSISDKVML